MPSLGVSPVCGGRAVTQCAPRRVPPNGRPTKPTTSTRRRPAFWTSSSAAPPQREQPWVAGSKGSGSSTVAEVRTRASRGDAVSDSIGNWAGGWEDVARVVRAVPKVVINSGIVSAFLGGLALRFATVDSDLWRGWSVWEIISNLPEDNWMFYQRCVEQQPLLTPMLITGATYYLADWIAQTYEGNDLLEFNAARLLRSTVTGLMFLGPLAHTYYTVQDHLFDIYVPNGGYAVEASKIVIDQTIYVFIYNMLYYLVTGVLKGHSLDRALSDFKAAAWRLQKAGWRLWPYVGLITHTIVPTQHKVLFVDAVEVVWVTYLSLSANAVRDKNVETVGDVLSAEEGEIQGESAAIALEALTTYVAEVRETSWSNELAPLEEEMEAAPVDSLPQDHLILAQQVEAAMEEKLARVVEGALAAEGGNVAGACEEGGETEETEGGEGEKVVEVNGKVEELVAEGIASIMEEVVARKEEELSEVNSMY